jgi:FG-GAP repeat/FG-GAP-like repeat
MSRAPLMHASFAALVVLASCDGSKNDGSGVQADSGLGGPERPTKYATPPPAEETAESTTADTGPPAESLACGRAPVAGRTLVCGDEDGDGLGLHVDVADVDGDGLAEVMVAEPYAHGAFYYYLVPPSYPVIHTAARILEWPTVDGRAHDVASVTVLGSGENAGVDYMAAPALLLPAVGQLATSGLLRFEDDYTPHFYDVAGLPSGSVLSTDAIVSSMFSPTPTVAIGVVHYGRCTTAGTPALCVVSIDRGYELPDWAGQVLVHPLPVADGTEVLSGATARYFGDPDDRAEVLEGEGDWDGDGVADMAIGAYRWYVATGLPGRVAILIDPPLGEHRVWDVATAVLEETEAGGEFGIAVVRGDLDGDGSDDLFVGAPIGDTPRAYVFRGPLSTDRTVAEADWTIDGALADEWVGYDAAVADFDGDGAADLAVGVPTHPVLATRPGRALIYSAPAPGTLTIDSADFEFSSGSTASDEFGLDLAAGDIDGDSLADLVVGAPTDPGEGVNRGSATILYGSAIAAP